jgi:hypothetical protein
MPTFWCDRKSSFYIVKFKDEFRYLNKAIQVRLPIHRTVCSSSGDWLVVVGNRRASFFGVRRLSWESGLDLVSTVSCSFSPWLWLCLGFPRWFSQYCQLLFQSMAMAVFRLSALMDLYIHPLYVLVGKILSSIFNSLAPIHHLYHHLSTLSTVGLTCHFI